MRAIVLASTSPYRRALLARLGLAFDVEAPRVDEAPRPGEPPAALVERLGRAKAAAVAVRRPEALVIGSDQVAVLDGRALGKPGDAAANERQLAALAGREIEFLTSLCLVDAARGTERCEVARTRVGFRALTPAQIRAYVHRERAFDCAGGFRAEALGGALFEHVRGDDPNALQGLPLYRLVAMLAEAGVDVLADGA